MAEAYELLGLDPEATKVQARSAYRDLAKQHHPDVGGDAEFFKRVTEAHEVISGKLEPRRGSQPKKKPATPEGRPTTSRPASSRDIVVLDDSMGRGVMVSIFGRPPVLAGQTYLDVFTHIARALGVELGRALLVGSDIVIGIEVRTFKKPARSTLAGLAYDVMHRTDFLTTNLGESFELPEWEDED